MLVTSSNDPRLSKTEQMNLFSKSRSCRALLRPGGASCCKGRVLKRPRALPQAASVLATNALIGVQYAWLQLIIKRELNHQACCGGHSHLSRFAVHNIV